MAKRVHDPSSSRTLGTSVVLLSVALAALVGCRDGGGGDEDPDAGTDNDGGDAGDDGGRNDGSTCALPGTYDVVSFDMVDGQCDYEPSDGSLAVRRAGPWMLIDFEGIDWGDALTNVTECSLEAQGPSMSYWNGALRTSSLELRVDEDWAEALFSDRLDGEDSEGRSCDVTYRIELEGSGQPPEGAAVGEDGCGGLGCSASRCAFGQIFGCDSGVCLLETTASGWPELFCSAPCDGDSDCPDGFECQPVYEEWSGAAPGSYCGRWRAECGNGELEEGEACDDGNTVSGDGCSADCSSDESCGNELFEPPEECDASAFEEWLPCTDECRFDPPDGVVTPLPLDSSNVRLASTGPAQFLAVASIADYDSPPLYIARTENGGESWTEQTLSAEDGAHPTVTDVSVDGERVVVGLWTSWGMFLAESADGGRSWSTAEAQTLPEGTSISDPIGGKLLRVLAAPAGGTVAAVGVGDGVGVIHRAAGASTWTLAGVLDTTAPEGATSCTWRWNAWRFESASSGAGVQLYRDSGQVRLVADGLCTIDGRFVHLTRTMVSDDGGASFGGTEDLVEAAGLDEAEVAFITNGGSSPAAVCIGGPQTDGYRGLFCGVAPTDGSTWSVEPTGITWTDAWGDGRPEALGRSASGRLVVAQRSYEEDGLRLHVREPSTGTWTSLFVPHANAFGHGIFPIAGDVIWVVAVDGDNEASLLRVDLSSGDVGDLEYLFGDARREDGSGYPWEVSWATDGSSRALLGFSLPDDLRGTVTVLRLTD